MIILGVVLALLGALLDVPLLWTIGIIVALVGIVLWILGYAGRGYRGRRHYW